MVPSVLVYLFLLFLASAFTFRSQPIKTRQHTNEHTNDRTNDKTLLLVVAASTDRVQTLVKRNLFALNNTADVGVVLYKGTIDDWAGVIKVAADHSLTFLLRQGVLPESVNGSTARPFRFIPKLHFQLQVKDWIEQYRWVWMADDDISFTGFDYQEFWHRHQHGFRGGGGPLVVQPLIRQNTQCNSFALNYDQWGGARRSIYVVTTNMIEQQVSLLHARFFLWLLARLEPLHERQLQVGNDWGIDWLWCQAARAYRDDRRHTSCALIPLPIEHENSNSINVAQDLSFLQAGTQILQWLRAGEDHSFPWKVLNHENIGGRAFLRDDRVGTPWSIHFGTKGELCDNVTLTLTATSLSMKD